MKKMNKKGQRVLVGMMMFVFLVIFAITMLYPLKESIEIARGADEGLGCSYTNLTTGESMTCIVVDIILPYFFLIVIMLIGGLIAYQRLEP